MPSCIARGQVAQIHVGARHLRGSFLGGWSGPSRRTRSFPGPIGRPAGLDRARGGGGDLGLVHGEQDQPPLSRAGRSGGILRTSECRAAIGPRARCRDIAIVCPVMRSSLARRRPDADPGSRVNRLGAFLGLLPHPPSPQARPPSKRRLADGDETVTFSRSHKATWRRNSL